MGKLVASASAPDNSWQAESDHRTLSDAQDITADSGRMRGVRAVHMKKQRAMGMVSKVLSKKMNKAGGGKALAIPK